MKKRYILSVAGISLAAVFFMQAFNITGEEMRQLEAPKMDVIQEALKNGEASLPPADKAAANQAGGQTSQGVADLPEPGKNESNMSTAEAGLEEQDQNSKELENPAENEIDIGADFEKSDNQGNENPQQQSLE